jgi:2-haloacid dehalogenase
MITNILFDLDNTLFDFNRAEALALSNTLLKIGIEPTEKILKRYSELNLAQWKRLELGEITRDEVKRIRYELLFQELGVDFSAAEATAIYESYLSVGHFFINGAEKLLQDISAFGKYRLYLVTNGTVNVQKGRLASSGISQYFDDIFISEEIGHNKPQLAYFEECFRRIPDFQKEKTVIVGDSLTSDIKGGVNAGIHTIWFNPNKSVNPSTLTPDYEIYSLEQLLPLLMTM